MVDQDHIEQALCAIWKEFLAVEVTPADDFFDLGGYSLLIVNVVIEARRLGIALSPDDVFTHRNPAAIAAALLGQETGSQRSGPPAAGHELAAFWLGGPGLQSVPGEPGAQAGPDQQPGPSR